MNTMLTIDEVAARYPHILVADMFRLGHKVGTDGLWRWDQAALETHLALTFDPHEWVAYSFDENGTINIAVLAEDGELAATFTPEQAKLMGIRLISLAYEIGTLTARENGVYTNTLTEIMRRYDVQYSDELFAAMTPADETEEGANA